MPQLITRQTVVADDWQKLELAADQDPASLALPAGNLLVPLAVWQARRSELLAGNRHLGLWLAPADRVEQIAEDLGHFALIAIDFPKFVDGRGYTSAALLRQRYGYHGELRAVGNILHDQLYYLRRVGFDSYALTDGKDAAHAIAHGFTTFSDAYQAATDQPLPAFRRRTA